MSENKQPGVECCGCPHGIEHTRVDRSNSDESVAVAESPSLGPLARLFCGSANRALGERLAECLGTKLRDVSLTRFADGECNVQFIDNIRGKNVYIVQPTCPPTNDNLVELLMMISACRRANANKVTALIPYYGYARSDRKVTGRTPIAAAEVSNLLVAAGLHRVICVDLHSGQIQGFFPPHCPVDNLDAQIVGINHFVKKFANFPVKPADLCIISPDAGGVYRCKSFQSGMIKQGYPCRLAMLIKQRSRPNEVESMELVGDVKGAYCIIADDMVDTAGTLCQAAKHLIDAGAVAVSAFATHGVLSGPAFDRIDASVLDELVITDSVNLDEAKVAASSKIVIESVAPLLAHALSRMEKNKSFSALFRSPERFTPNFEVHQNSDDD